MAYSLDLRVRAVELYQGGEYTYDEVAEMFAIGRASVSRWLSLKRENGTPHRRKHGGGPPIAVDEKGVEIVISLVEQTPDLTLEELTNRYNRRRKKRSVSIATIGRVLRNTLGFTRKKRLFVPPNRTPRRSSANDATIAQPSSI